MNIVMELNTGYVHSPLDISITWKEELLNLIGCPLFGLLVLKHQNMEQIFFLIHALITRLHL